MTYRLLWLFSLPWFLSQIQEDVNKFACEKQGKFVRSDAWFAAVSLFAEKCIHHQHELLLSRHSRKTVLIRAMRQTSEFRAAEVQFQDRAFRGKNASIPPPALTTLLEKEGPSDASPDENTNLTHEGRPGLLSQVMKSSWAESYFEHFNFLS